ncbi:MAG: 8-amino-7-oxononanoate synthase [Alphaproteobacteria bacterium]|nr:8-amino-7-oxononanoate synthase [Alphaproteobacteria bacterium]
MKFYAEALRLVKEKKLYRQLVATDVLDAVAVKRNDKEMISFASNDYFGLSQNPAVKEAAVKAIAEYGVGSGGSRYIAGNNSLNSKLEKEIARMKGYDDAIVFSSGYSCAIGVIPALVSEGDLVVADRLIHSSLIDGIKLSGARLMRFLHNDISHAQKILSEHRGKFKKCLILTETVFSMDGDLGRVNELLDLAKTFDSLFLSDSAHEIKVSDTLVSDTLSLRLGTLSKAIGTLGGYVVGEQGIIDYLRIFAKSAIYSTTLPPAILAASIASLKIIKEENLGEKALANAKYFCELMNLAEPQSAIVPIILGDGELVMKIAKNLEEKSLLVSAIRPPTVEKGKSRLRITFSTEHTKDQIKKLAEVLQIECADYHLTD